MEAEADILVTGKLSIARQLALSPMQLFSRRIEHPLDVPIDRMTPMRACMSGRRSSAAMISSKPEMSREGVMMHLA
jgi:hypothetical protein